VPVPDSFEALIVRLAARDEASAAAVVRDLYDRVVGLVRPRINPAFAAKVSPESIANSAFKSFFLRHADTPYPIDDEAGLFRLLSAIALAKCSNRIRRFRAAGRDAGREIGGVGGGGYDPAAGVPGPEFEVEVSDLLESLTKELSEVEREVIYLSLAGTPVEEAAVQVGLSTRTVIRIRTRFARRLEAGV
jgi:DNA-directed RNA polymerase specialized sigma24 family protein